MALTSNEPACRDLSIMASSVVKRMGRDRAVVREVVDSWPFMSLVGALPADEPAHAASSFVATTAMARECDLYLLLLGPTYGWTTPDGRSATEIEFDAAYAHDPTKILVFLKKSKQPTESAQLRFIKKVTDYTKGYWRPTYNSLRHLRSLLCRSCQLWLTDRVTLATQLGPFHFFVANAIQMRPAAHVAVEYNVRASDVRLKYRYQERVYEVTFPKDAIMTDFWGSLQTLQAQLRRRFGR